MNASYILFHKNRYYHIFRLGLIIVYIFSDQHLKYLKPRGFPLTSSQLLNYHTSTSCFELHALILKANPWSFQTSVNFCRQYVQYRINCHCRCNCVCEGNKLLYLLNNYWIAFTFPVNGLALFVVIWSSMM